MLAIHKLLHFILSLESSNYLNAILKEIKSMSIISMLTFYFSVWLSHRHPLTLYDKEDFYSNLELACKLFSLAAIILL